MVINVILARSNIERFRDTAELFVAPLATIVILRRWSTKSGLLVLGTVFTIPLVGL